jgi:hypothetical protein
MLDQRADTTIIVQELASHGYVVVTVDHTYDAFSEFPGGRLTVPREDVVMLPPDFARDIRSVLDKIEGFARGDGADLRGAVDLGSACSGGRRAGRRPTSSRSRIGG